MIILPAIDVIDGRCVRLFQGDYSTAHEVAGDPAETAAQFYESGARWIHMVDLDGAKSGSAKNAPLFMKIAKESGLKVELGGGIRDMKTVEYYLEHGISRIILGSAAVKDPSFVKEAVAAYQNRIAVGIDAKNGMVATHGWVDTSDISYLELAKRMEDAGVCTIIFTDIAKDGMLEGLNLEQLAAINEAVDCNIIASGGVRSLEDISACMKLGLYGVICGKSIYSGNLSLREAVEMAGEEQC